ncbi:aquaporin-like protein [Naematelia encephala]|uniref:Aquaporin-like protein n=1 Tax=Naematelia encephala TaxID=71784 RepID=A0A1Y2AKX0_9TREE|nr:aquaporin-like protein [Naematelia encephala]
MSQPTHNNAPELDASHPKRREQLKGRNPLTWNLTKPQQGPASLALKNHFIAMVGEYVGTVLFMIFALGGTNVALIPSTSITGDTTSGQDGTQASTVNTSNLLYIALSFGFSLAVNAWIFFRVSGGLFNPAVSLGMVLVGALTPLRGALLTFAQIVGGITGAAIIQAITPGTLNVRTTLGGGTSIVQGLFIEMFLTSLLMLAILLLAAEKHKATFIAPIGIGLALFVAELLGVYYTGGSLNPARSFGPAVVLKTFSGYHWIYWLGPALGATIAAGFYRMLKWLQYETVLGPETEEDESPKTSGPANGGTQDIEKTAGTGPTAPAGRTLALSGPGLADLHTEGPNSGVYDLERHPGPLENRLDRIEMLLQQLNASRMGNESRLSTGTYVDEPQHHHHKKVIAPVHEERRYVSAPTTEITEDTRYIPTERNTVSGRTEGEGNRHAPFTHGVAGSGPRDHFDVLPR